MTDHRYFLVCLLGIMVLLAPNFTAAQPAYELPQVIAKISVAHLLDPLQPSLHLAWEHCLQNRWYLHHQAGYLFRNFSSLNVENQRGFRFRSGIRHYMQASANRSDKIFVEFSGSYTHSNIQLKDDFCRFDCAYFQRLTYNRLQNIYTLAVDYGAANYFSKRFLIEIAVSGGLRLGNIRYSDLPPDAALTEDIQLTLLSYRTNPTVFPIHFGVRLKLGFVLK